MLNRVSVLLAFITIFSVANVSAEDVPKPQPQSTKPGQERIDRLNFLVEWIGTRTSSFFCDATVDRFDGAGYKPGETFFVRIASEKAGYLALILIDPDGVSSGLETNLPLPKSIETSGQMIEIPLDIESSAAYKVPNKAGIYRVKVFVTERPVQWPSLQMQRQNHHHHGSRTKRTGKNCEILEVSRKTARFR